MTALSVVTWLARFVIAALAGALFILGVACVVQWREQLKTKKPGERVGPILAMFAWLFFTVGLLILQTRDF